MIESIRISIDNRTCHRSGSNGIRTIITIGEVSGIILIQVARVPCGSPDISEKEMAIENTKGMVWEA